jgi:hypothetical protein
VTGDTWPALPLSSWQDTLATLHRWTQIVGKLQLALTPRENHFWNVAFDVTARGLRTRRMPYDGGDADLQITFDFIDHNLVIETSRHETRGLALAPRTVADFYREFVSILSTLGIEVAINDHPVEIFTEAIPFHEDVRHRAYDREPVEQCFQLLRAGADVLSEFRGRFIGKASPVHFFWGSFDLAASRYSGRLAPTKVGADPITKESYSHEVFSAGFWPGDARFSEPAWYAYHSPVPKGFAEAHLLPPAATWNATLGEFLLPHEEVRNALNPREMLLDFFQSAYEAAADLAQWDRGSLEVTRPPFLEPQPTMH